jgi:hypothetical protein
MNFQLCGSRHVSTHPFHGSVKQSPADSPTLEFGQHEEQGDMVAVAEGTHAHHATIKLGDDREALPMRQRAQVVRGYDLGKEITSLLGVIGGYACFEAFLHDRYDSVRLSRIQHG